MFWQQLRQHEGSGIDLEEKEEMDTTEGEPWTPGIQTSGSLHPRQCLLLPGSGLGSEDQAKDLVYSGFHADQFSNHSSRQTPRTIEYLSGKGPPRWCYPWFSIIFSMEQREHYSGGERGFCGQICLGNAGLSRFLCVQDVSEPLC